MRNKLNSSMYITLEAHILLGKMAETMGISRNSVMELAIRAMAKREKISIEKEKEVLGIRSDEQ